MLRMLIVILLIAFTGSVLSSVALMFAMPGDSPRIVAGLAAASMIFTVPGAILLIGVAARLRERDISAVQRGVTITALGAGTGALILALGGWPAVCLGLLFGLTTAIVLLAMEPLLRR